MNKLIRVIDLHKCYSDGTIDEVEVLKGIDLEIFRGEIVAILGTSGVGKSTLLHLIGGLDRPTSGQIFYEDQDIFTFPDRELDRFRNLEIGFVFQFHHLLPEFSALENVAIGALISEIDQQNAFDRADQLLDYVGLSHRKDHQPTQLSGGERQRVAVARALINQPTVILADEPTGNLDGKTSENILELLWSLNHQLDQTIILVTHDEQLAKRADRIVKIVDGKISDPL